MKGTIVWTALLCVVKLKCNLALASAGWQLHAVVPALPAPAMASSTLIEAQQSETKKS